MTPSQPLIIFIAGLLALIMTGCTSNKPIILNDHKKISGEITAIDKDTKTMTVHSIDGVPVTVPIYNMANDPDMKFVGKSVDVQLHRSFTLTLCKPDDVVQAENSSEKSAYVERIDFEENMLLLKQGDGSILSLEIKEKANEFHNVKQGDRMIVTHIDSPVVFVKENEMSSITSGP